MSQFGVLVTWHDVTGTQPNMDLLRGRLAPFGLNSVLVALARLAAILQTWQNQPALDTDRSLAEHLLPTYYARIKEIYEAEASRVTFTRIGILFVAKQALIACPNEGLDLRTREDVERLLSAVLIANDLFLGRRPESNDTTVERASSLLPFSNYVPQNSYSTDLARNLLLIEEIAPILAGRAGYIDFAASFLNATGLTVRQFCELSFGACLRFITNVDEQFSNPSVALVLSSHFFHFTDIPEPTIAILLSRLSTTTDVLRIQARNSHATDFLLFQRHPLIQIVANGYVCPDPGFLLDKAGASLYWTLHEATAIEHRLALLTQWSGMIEYYSQWLFERTYQGSGRFVSSPRFPNNDEAADALLLEGSTLLLFEVKASVLTVQAKYGDSAEGLMNELSLKAISGEDGERKGVAQLVRSITRFLDGETISGVSREGIRTIIPILVFLDRGFTSPYLNGLYNESFDSARFRRAYRRTVTPLFSITIDDLENVLPYTDKHEFRDILESYYRVNRERHSTLSRGRIPLLQGSTPGRDIVRERFNRFGAELEHRFFPNGRGESLPVQA